MKKLCCLFFGCLVAYHGMVFAIPDGFSRVVSENFSNIEAIDKLRYELCMQKENLDKNIFSGSNTSVKDSNDLSFLSIQCSRLITLLDAIKEYSNEKNEKNKLWLKRLSQTYDESVENAVLVFIGEQTSVEEHDEDDW